jgi:hypothetical protein
MGKGSMETTRRPERNLLRRPHRRLCSDAVHRCGAPWSTPQALLAPRPAGLNAVQLAAMMRRNQELLLHWVVEQVRRLRARSGREEGCSGSSAPAARR